MAYTISPNMNLVVPGVGTEYSPNWATDLNADLSILDGHNHSLGSGVQITPNGIDINLDLPFNDNNATLLRSARFQVQATLLSGANDLGCLYVSGVDLYYNDENGNQIKITAGGAVNATSSGISSGTATASFVAGVLVVDAAANTPANIQGASVLLGNNSAGTNYLTLAPPSAMASSYQITLPSLPSSTLPVSISNTGTMSAAPITYAQLSSSLQTPPTKQIFMSGSGTYTPTTTGVIWIEVEMVGGGGGGGGGTSSGQTGSNGSATTFGPMTAGPGEGGNGGSTLPAGGNGGSASLGSGPIGIALTGAGGSAAGTQANMAGVPGAVSPFGGAGQGNGVNNGGGAAVNNTGSGGAGGSSTSGGGGTQGGSAGGAGGYIECIISGSLLSSIISSGAAYSVGTGGPGGQGSGGGTQDGGAGGSGLIVVTEYYSA